MFYYSTFLYKLESGIRERNYWLHLPSRKHVEFLLLKIKRALCMVWASKMSKIRLLPVMRFSDPTGMVSREWDIPSTKNFKENKEHYLCDALKMWSGYASPSVIMSGQGELHTPHTIRLRFFKRYQRYFVSTMLGVFAIEGSTLYFVCRMRGVLCQTM